MPKRVKSPGDWDDAALRNLSSDARYLIGVSGGRDSVVLLHWLLARGYKKLIICHLEHGLRRRAGRADGRFVQQLAARAKLPFETKTDDVQARAKANKCSIETAARAARYEFFARVSRKRRCPTIFLGHHADDLVETFLFNLLRGSGSEGQGSIRTVSVRQSNGVSLTVVRPLLGVWREEIDAYVKANRLRFREDASNRSLEPTRNRIRHRIIPLIEKEFGRTVRRSLWRAAEIAAEEHAVLEEMMPPDVARAGKLKIAAVSKLPIALQRRAIRRWLREHQIGDVSFDLIEEARALLEPAARVAKINLPGDRHARRRAGEMFIE